MSNSDFSSIFSDRVVCQGKTRSYQVPIHSTHTKVVTVTNRHGVETKRVQCEYCPKTHINTLVYNLHVNTGKVISLIISR